MAWRIHLWSRELGEGHVVAPHYGPLPFSGLENVDGILDFVVGEVVIVQLGDNVEGQPPVLRVSRPKTRHDDMPPSTRCVGFDDLNSHELSDYEVIHSDSERAVVWFFSCCSVYEPGFVVTFHKPLYAPRGDWRGNDPWLRYATPTEVAAAGLSAPEGASAYCLLGAGYADEPSTRFVVLASQFSVEPWSRSAHGGIVAVASHGTSPHSPRRSD